MFVTSLKLYWNFKISAWLYTYTIKLILQRAKAILAATRRAAGKFANTPR